MTNPTDGRITSLAVFAGRLSTTDLLSVVAPGNATSGINYGLPFQVLATNIASTILPNSATGTILFGQGSAIAPSFLVVAGDIGITNNSAIATATIATHAVSFAKFQQVVGLSVVGVAGTATADTNAITASGASQVLQSDPTGTTLIFGPLGTGTLPGPFQVSSFTANRVLIGNGTSPIALSNVATTAFPLVGNGTALAPGFAVLSVPGGGTNTTALTQAGVLYGNGTSTIGITAAGGTGLPLTASGGTAAPAFAALTVPGGGSGTTTLTANRVLIGNGTTTLTLSNVATTGFPLIGNGTSAAPGFAVLGVPGGGLGTATTTPYAVLAGGTTATAQIQSLATTGASGLVLTSQGSAALPIWGAAGAGNVTGPGSSTDKAAARFNGTNGTTIQNSALIIDDTTGRVSRSGNGGIQQQGTNTADLAAAGDVGEYISSAVEQGSAIALTSGVTVNITGIPLTAGDWEANGAIYYNAAATTTISTIAGSISLTSATLDQTAGNYGQVSYNALIAAGVTQVPTVHKKITIAAAATAYLVSFGNFGAAALSSFGKIEARRAR